jgi:hypothetical protein
MFLKCDPYRVWCSIFPHIGKTGRLDFSLFWLKGEVRENLGDFRKSIQILTFLSPLLHVPGVLDKTLCDKVCQWLAEDLWFSPGTSVSSTNKTERHNITETLLKVALSIIILTRSRYNILPMIIYSMNVYF